MARSLIGVILLALALYLGVGGLLFVFQRSLIYFPQPRAIGGPDRLLMLPVTDQQIAVTVRPLASPKALIYFGGNAEDVSRSLPDFGEAFPDHALYLLHYRGFGDSTGKPSEAAIQNDALELFDKVSALHGEVAVVGRSLGSGVAIRLASQRPVARLVLVTPYNSILELAQRQFPIYPVRWMLQDTYESWRYAPAISIPTLLIVAERDEVIPRWSSEKLFAQFRSGVARREVIPGVGHNDIGGRPEYLELIRSGL
ncbi:alpha/beta hydrolase [Pseudomonas sp. TCU-HL1]|uniref:alpha/beta hydrolase n=1 Tax=Pseudomonas sp. TCU-HL1 TaxID=1856685 RepID=UPI00083CF0E0|nr:alpha/beta fold hydrolase [Pseudomonas sp. TCU-HL1]AOE84311.1 PhoP family transcriptional regulator [Pseudomonas sp. TCU-HL1]